MNITGAYSICAEEKLSCSQVHSFDPTIGMKTQQRSKRATFHNLGLSNVSKPNGPGLRVCFCFFLKAIRLLYFKM